MPLAPGGNVSVFASGLDAPRGLKFGPDGTFYVAEAGCGGSTPSASFVCDHVPTPIGPYFGGPAARISKITGSGQVTTVVEGLPFGMSSLPSGDTLGVIRVDVEHATWNSVAGLAAFQQANQSHIRARLFSPGNLTVRGTA
jgi:hypothetical protein